MTVGVPEISPVEVLKDNPAGKLGFILKPETVPETEVNKLEIGLPTVKTFGEVYESEFGAIAFTVITTPKVVAPPELAAVTV